eukprot:gnl/Dysnectes_brevis/260_a291_6437.p1 GENE.gnl/Dysnectes_brevis/260_a291_6437~~gnl/Dysnectes_brevis/260_a291_6437.p1  ORF type:complete len:232 (-),score=98.21 gnl/Dysnectes_brevis/260_a291_6437:31-726(-)
MFNFQYVSDTNKIDLIVVTSVLIGFQTVMAYINHNKETPVSKLQKKIAEAQQALSVASSRDPNSRVTKVLAQYVQIKQEELKSLRMMPRQAKQGPMRMVGMIPNLLLQVYFSMLRPNRLLGRIVGMDDGIIAKILNWGSKAEYVPGNISSTPYGIILRMVGGRIIRKIIPPAEKAMSLAEMMEMQQAMQAMQRGEAAPEEEPRPAIQLGEQFKELLTQFPDLEDMPALKAE